jgi:hypothetical protein
MTRRMQAFRLLVVMLLASTGANAQGALSVLGFGYPVGGMSARGLATGTSIAGLDPHSPVNPASIVLNARAQGYLQFEPEYRSVTVGGTAVKTTTSRFPVFMISGRQGRATFSLSYSAFLDRTWANSYADTQTVNGERIASTVVAQSAGGITDARFGAAWSFSEKVHVGLGLHMFPGQNRVVNGRIFPDSSKTGSFTLQSDYNFSGSAVSLGGVFVPGGHFVLSADMRMGGSLRMTQGDSMEVGKGKVPFRAGVSVTYDGIPGSVFSARIGTDKWSDLAGLGTASLDLRDATDLAFGTEITGPRYMGAPVFVRAGYRTRGLPVAYGTAPVNEQSLSGGLGIPVAGGRSNIDLSVVRATRTASGVSEKAWLVSIGVGIRP